MGPDRSRCSSVIPAGMMKVIHSLAIIADDLTGANDTGIQFVKQGLSTLVVFGSIDFQSLYGEVDVVAVATDSRWSSPPEAYSRVRAVAAALRALGVSRVYKKIDSTLRGNIGAELDAVMDVFESEVAFVVPAFPATGRVTLHGRQLVKDVPLDQTEMALDPVSPVTESHIPTIISEQTQRQIGHVALDRVDQGVSALRDLLEEKTKAGDQIIVVDAVTQDHLSVIAGSIASLNRPCVVAGSAGLAAELPQALKMTVLHSSSALKRSHQGVLVIGGTLSRVLRPQFEYAKSTLGLHTMPVGVRGILDDSDCGSQKTQELVSLAISRLSAGRDVAISVDPGSGAARTARVGDLAPEGDAVGDSRRITDYLGSVAASILASCPVSGLVLTGGDTAVAVCRSLGAVGLVLLNEIQPGMPAGRLIGGPYDGLIVVTKAGSFGEKDAIARAIRYVSDCGDSSSNP